MRAVLLGLGGLALAFARSAERGRGERAGLTIGIAPVGAASPAVIERLVEPLRLAFGADVRAAPALRLPSSGYEASRGQYLAASILDALAAAKSPVWDRLLGVADVDLYAPGLNFVFGEGDSRRGVAIFSLARLNSPSRAIAEARAATEAVHELGHSFGLSHCDDPHCVMWFSNTLAESDRKGTRFCPRHAAQVEALSARSGASAAR